MFLYFNLFLYAISAIAQEIRIGVYLFNIINYDTYIINLSLRSQNSKS